MTTAIGTFQQRLHICGTHFWHISPTQRPFDSEEKDKGKDVRITVLGHRKCKRDVPHVAWTTDVVE